MCFPANEMLAPNKTPIAKRARKTKRSRKVSFREDRTSVAVFESPADEKKNEMWYNKHEIDIMRDNARYNCHQLKTYLGAIEYGDEARGLEFRTDRKRQERQRIIIKLFVRSQSKYKDPRQMAQIYKKCGTWSNAAAIVVGQKDFNSANGISDNCKVPSMADYPLPFKSYKRSAPPVIAPEASRNVCTRRSITVA